MPHPSQRAGVRRLKAATARLESQPYSFGAPTRTPRLGGAAAGIYWCQLGSSMAAAAGTWGSQTLGSLSGQTVYQVVSGAQVALPGTYKVYNAWPTTFAASKTTALSPNGDGTFSIAEQAC